MKDLVAAVKSTDRGSFLITHEMLMEAPHWVLNSLETTLIEKAKRDGLMIMIDEYHRDGIMVHWRPDSTASSVRTDFAPPT